jgi:hypothetical protein
MSIAANHFRFPFHGLTRPQEYEAEGRFTDFPKFKHIGEDIRGSIGSDIVAAASGVAVTAAKVIPQFLRGLGRKTCAAISLRSFDLWISTNKGKQ